MGVWAEKTRRFSPFTPIETNQTKIMAEAKKKAEAEITAPAIKQEALKKEEDILKENKAKDTIKPIVDTSGIQVDDPEDIVPKELPLVINPPKGKEWANEEQVEYAKVLNAYAYKNPKKWKANKIKDPETLEEIPNSSKRYICISNLAKLEKNPELFKKFTGYSLQDKQTFKIGNKLG